jgi:hypothetical protein
MEPLGRTLLIAGLVFVAVGVLLTVSPNIPLLGKLPGDIRIERPGLRFYLPVTSCILLSMAISAGLSLLARLR